MTLPLPAAPFERPYYAAVFVYTRTAGDDGYAERAEEMAKLVASQPGFLGVDSAYGSDRFGVLVSYWRDEPSIAAWHDLARHVTTQADGRARWYEAYTVHVARVERAYGWTRPVTRG